MKPGNKVLCISVSADLAKAIRELTSARTQGAYWEQAVCEKLMRERPDIAARLHIRPADKLVVGGER